jgi:hypothetical protein
MSDKMWLRMARLVPRRLRYWCMIVSGAEATQGKWSNTVVPELTFMEALDRVSK